MKKVGICTVYTGYNYGSALQAVATKYYLQKLQYCGQIWKLSGSVVRNRDVRIKKAVILGAHLLLHPSETGKVLSSYVGKPDKTLSNQSKDLFGTFYNTYIQPICMTEGTARKMALSDEWVAFLCGSDQIWNSTTHYVDPFYYLRFAPEKKRIAFAPSFGRDYIPKYNQKKLKRNIQGIPYLSVREESGKPLIQNLTGRSAEVLVDPTLLLDQQSWVDLLHLQKPDRQNYVLAYFLNEPSAQAKRVLKQFSDQGYQILSLPYERQADWFDVCENAGPKEFLEYLWGADAVCTDSFHGVAFSLNFEKNFYAFDREYGGAAKQSTRVISLLGKTGLLNRYDSAVLIKNEIDYAACRKTLDAEREKSKAFLLQALQSVEKGDVK